jgi:hypothetical protein
VSVTRLRNGIRLPSSNTWRVSHLAARAAGRNNATALETLAHGAHLRLITCRCGPSPTSLVSEHWEVRGTNSAQRPRLRSIRRDTKRAPNESVTGSATLGAGFSTLRPAPSSRRRSRVRHALPAVQPVLGVALREGVDELWDLDGR